jgi:hypothetical protein
MPKWSKPLSLPANTDGDLAHKTGERRLTLKSDFPPRISTAPAHVDVESSVHVSRQRAPQGPKLLRSLTSVQGVRSVENQSQWLDADWCQKEIADVISVTDPILCNLRITLAHYRSPGMGGWDRTPNDLGASQATNWADLSDRMNFIVDLFRSRHLAEHIRAAVHRRSGSGVAGRTHPGRTTLSDSGRRYRSIATASYPCQFFLLRRVVTERDSSNDQIEAVRERILLAQQAKA